MRFRLLPRVTLSSDKLQLLKRLRERAAAGQSSSQSASVAETINQALRQAGLLPKDGAGATMRTPSWMHESAETVPQQPTVDTDTDTASEGSQGEAANANGTFKAFTHQTQWGRRRYWLFTPPAADEQPRPLLMMLHGCTQAPEDFALGTRMNDVARQHGVMVVYPMQTKSDNPNRCWNWFRTGDQKRNAGEPAELAALVRELVGRGNVDPERVYIAGMSAGAAMASILAREFPQLFAAVGMHSGLVAGAAHDMVSALGAMQGRVPLMKADATSRSSMPLITFHGDRDTTVVSANADSAVAAHAGSLQSTQGGRDGREYTRRCYGTGATGCTIEQWTIHGGGHAWSGGDARGSHTDAAGPDASREMMRFFLSHSRR